MPGLYTTGWIKRGPVGLIGNTKSDATETIGMLLDDAEAGNLSHSRDEDIVDLFESKGLEHLTWEGWKKLDAAERALGEAEGRERKKFVEWEEMVLNSRGD